MVGFLCGLAGLVVGAALSWLILGLRLSRLREDRAGAAGRADFLQEQLGKGEAEIRRLQEELLKAQSRVGEAEANYRNLKSEFENHAQKLLEETGSRFVLQNKEGLNLLIQPLLKQLEDYQRQLAESEKQKSQAYGALLLQIEQLQTGAQALSRETEQFRAVLKSSQARGRWGEDTLRRVVEAAGMSPHCDFQEQSTSDDSRPDLIVNLPEKRKIVIDAKASNLEFLQELEQADPLKRAEALRSHAQSLRTIIKELGRRDYPSKFEGSLDYVVCFIPAESLFSAALEGDPELIQDAAAQKVILATPASLIALLRAVSVSWRQYQQNAEIRKIAESASQLYQRVITLMGHVEGVRDGLDKAVRAMNSAQGSYERMVRPKGEELARLGADAKGKAFLEIEPVQELLPKNGMAES
jgi:DNA recombination protein RmuC